MSPLQTLAILIGGLAFAFVVFVLIPRGLVAAFRKDLEARIQHRYTAPDQVVSVAYSATFFGLYARGQMQWRGSGALALTKTELAFFQALPQRVLTIPVARIAEVSLMSRHLGKPSTSLLLRVTFATSRGSQDTVAFWLKEPAPLKAQIEALPDYRAGSGS